MPHSPVFNSQEVVDGELAKHHEIVLETEGPHGTFRTIRSPLRFDGEKPETVVAPPDARGSTTKKSLAALGQRSELRARVLFDKVAK